MFNETNLQYHFSTFSHYGKKGNVNVNVKKMSMF